MSSTSIDTSDAPAQEQEPSREGYFGRFGGQFVPESLSGALSELTAAWRDWNDRTGRFGAVASPLRRIEAPPPPWIRPDGSEIPARTRRAD